MSRGVAALLIRFSALQRAENSSIESDPASARVAAAVSVLFSEPKIPQWVPMQEILERLDVSVLFSEPKIPQS